jgi:glycosyltransferase involved in cell wall biosynthesis
MSASDGGKASAARGAGEDQTLLFTVNTSTFNRAHTLPRAYESLTQQTLQNFEWLVVDDGSTDGTRDLVRSWIEEAPFPIRYFYQPNAGQNVCENRAAQFARGALMASLDSDDWYVPTALETFARAWDSIDPTERDEFVGIVALCVNPNGSLIGTPFPQDVLDTTYTEMRNKYGVVGDKAGCSRTEVVRSFPFPVFEGERHPMPGIAYRRIAREYRARCVNQTVKVVDYQPDGIMANHRLWSIKSPRTMKLYFLESLTDKDIGTRERLWNYANYVRFSLHGRRCRESWGESPSKLAWLVTAPAGALAYARDRILER